MSTQGAPNPFAEPGVQPPQQIPRNNLGPLWWILGGAGLLLVTCCGGVLAFLVYLGAVAPETSVYTGNQVPSRFLDTAREVGALEQGENVLFFYSDALTDIREGFYFVSDQKVVVYVADSAEGPLTAIPFDQIESVEIYRDESFLTDSQIMIQTTDGQYVALPVSSEFDRDQAFFEAIESRVKQ